MADGSPVEQVADSPPDQATPSGKAERVRRFLSRIPHAVIALVLVFLAVPFDVQGPAIFLVGPVRRLNWRHALVMALAAAGVCFGLTPILDRVRGLHTLLPVIGLLQNLLVVLSIGVGEMLLTRRWSWRRLARVGGLGLVALCAFRVVIGVLYWSEIWVRVPHVPFGYQSTSLSSFMYYPLLAVAVWVAVPRALREGSAKARWRRLAAAGGVISSVAFLAVFFGVLAYPLARWSLVGSGPVSRHRAVYLLEFRGREADFDFIWRVLTETDWRESLTYTTRSWSGVLHGESYPDDWREVAVDVLAEHDAADAAERLSKMLLAQPTLALAHCAAEVLSENRRYETAPILLRYAMIQDRNCTEALEAMRVPQGALPILRHEIYWARRVERRDDGTEDCVLDDKTQESLRTLLGADAEPRYQAWARLYDSRIKEAPTPLTEAVRADTDRVVACMLRFYVAKGRLLRAWRELAHRNLVRDGKGKAADVLRKWYEQDDGDPRAPEPPANVVEAGETVMEYFRQAVAEMRVAEPDWDAPTTDLLEKEVEGYAARVEARIEEYFPATGQVVREP